MSGHSKWSTIKRQKGAADMKRGQTFTKIANAIKLSARTGGGDPDSNPKLRVAIDEAKDVNMPKDNIQRAIDRGLGNIAGQNLEEVSYEAYGPGRVAFYIEGVTDNKLRTNQEIKGLLERSGGSLVGQGSVAYLFDRKGEIRVKGKGKGVDDEILELMDSGADDIEDYQEDGLQKYLVYTQQPNLTEVVNKITQMGYQIESKDIVFQPNTTTDINDVETAQKVINLAEKLESLDDVQKVYANFNLSNEVSEQLGYS